ncbi:MAG TPA: FAD-dependent oxidoreductase [Gemmatimonadaceae bacterium]|jgi:glycine/D-amino acid oxidase-like deaminating enzyme
MLTPLISRRQALKAIAITCAAPSFLASACARAARQVTASPNWPGARRLARVLVSPDRVIRTVVGLRPFRRTGFRVAPEMLGDKTIVHNYGHGGGGVSLSWGTAELATEIARATPHRTAAVLGCGAVGLATARLLQDSGFGVTIYARDLPPATTSNIAGAQWSPVTVADSDARTPEFDAQFVRASRFAYRYFQTLVGPRSGVSWRDNFVISDNPQVRRGWEMTLLGDLVQTATLQPGEHPFGRRYALHFLTMHIEPSVYLATVLADFRIAGGRVVVREFPDRQAIAQLTEPLIVNCTGLGAGQLFGDADVLPIKGQLTVLAPQGDVDYITVGPGDLYMMPRQDGIVLGGTHERGVWSLEPNLAEVDRILAGHRALFDGMT